MLTPQETVTWDLRTTCYDTSSMVAKLYFLYLFVVSTYVLVKAARLWYRLGLSNLPILEFRANLIQLVQAGNFVETPRALKKLPERFPEHAIWSAATNSPDFRQLGLMQILESTTVLIQDALNRLSSGILNFHRIVTFTLLFGLFVALSEGTQVTRGISLEKTTGISAVVGGINEVLLLAASGVFVAGWIYLLFWHFDSRLRHRYRLWHDFLLRAKSQSAHD